MLDKYHLETIICFFGSISSMLFSRAGYKLTIWFWIPRWTEFLIWLVEDICSSVVNLASSGFMPNYIEHNRFPYLLNIFDKVFQ